MLYPKNFEEKIGFDRIRELIKAQCLSELGRQRADKIKLSSSFAFLNVLINQVDEFKTIVLMEDDFPLNHFFDVTKYLKKIKVEGTYLLAEELFDIKRSLETIKAILHFFKKRREEEKYPYLQRLTENVTLYPFIFDLINSILTSNGKVKDNASPELKQIRMDIRSKESAVSKRLQSIMKAAQKEGIVDQEASLTVRDGRTVIPVDASNKRKIKGFVHDESATGKTAYIEPAEIVELNNSIKELYYAEHREIVKVLTRVTGEIRPYTEDLMAAYDFLGTIDFIRAKAKFALKINGIKPIMVKKPFINWFDAVHPLLFLSFQKESRKVVPLTVNLKAPNQRILLISGPNAGGKSVCLQTVGLIQYMFQCGLLVPVKENSELGIFQQIFLNIGDDQSIDNDLSTYSSHLIHMKHFLKNAQERSLVLIDEFGSGTEPMLGGAIAESILDALNERKTFGVITTHYTNLKHFASSVEGIENGAMLFDTENINPLFKLSIGEPGSSFAFEIARKIGLPEFILKSATDKLGKEHIDFDKNLKDIIRDKRYWENKRDNIRRSEKELERLMGSYKTELEKADKERKEIIQNAKAEAESLLAGVNKQIENTIKTIKEKQAEKEATREARKKLEGLKEKVQQQDSEEQKKIQRKIEKLKNKESKVLKKGKTKPEKAVVKEPKKEKPLEKGDKVVMKGQDTAGEVMDVNGNSVMVGFGNIITTVKIDKLTRISDKEYKQKTGSEKSVTQRYNFDSRRLDFKPDIDIRGKRAEEALEIVRDFIDEAIMINMSPVRILHGKGDGILRHLIREYLATVDLVKNYKDEHIQFGGSGITVVEIDT